MCGDHTDHTFYFVSTHIYTHLRCVSNTQNIFINFFFLFIQLGLVQQAQAGCSHHEESVAGAGNQGSKAKAQSPRKNRDRVR